MDRFNPELMRQVVNRVLSIEWCRENLVVPLVIHTGLLEKDETTIVVAIANISYIATIGSFIIKQARLIGCDVHFTERGVDYISNLLSQIAVLSPKQEDCGSTSLSGSDQTFVELLRAEAEHPIVQSEIIFKDNEELCDVDKYDECKVELQEDNIQMTCGALLVEAVHKNMTDIHIAPDSEKYIIRVRINGMMKSYATCSRANGTKTIACLKSMAKMDASERRASQDGMILRDVEGQKVMFKCSTAAAMYGEKMFIRIMSTNVDVPTLDNIITNSETKNAFRETLHEANGLIIISGPTGAGKSTTLASILKEIDNGFLNIVTAEDPVEYELGGNIIQFPVIWSDGQSYANLIRTFIRQDPDVIMIDVIRDHETADSLLVAAETGHLVFTSLRTQHTHTAASAISQFHDMGVAPYKITASLRGILSQRLLWQVCPACSSTRSLNKDESAFLGLSEYTTVKIASVLSTEEKNQRYSDGTLCRYCNGNGYKGRIAAFELLQITPAIREAIMNHSSSRTIEDIATEEGMLTFKQYGAKLIAKQLTTVSEVYKICSS